MEDGKHKRNGIKIKDDGKREQSVWIIRIYEIFKEQI